MSGFAERPVCAMLADGRRINLRHGPIDLIIEADGAPDEVQRAYAQARAAFETILTDLVSELGLLRSPITVASTVPAGTVAKRMHRAALAHCDRYVTPMVSVAGAVADHVLAALMAGRNLRRAYVNNGGDIALFTGDGASFDIGICANPQTGELAGKATIKAADMIGGVATSGWRGRSHSLGIADAVTVLACDAATADAAATIIANEVTLDRSDAIGRAPACELAPDSDLGDRLVTTNVMRLSSLEIDEALARGAAEARGMVEAKLIEAAFLCLQGEIRIEGSSRYAAAVSSARAKQLPEPVDA